MNILILSKDDPAIAEAVAGCEVGKPQTFTITATPISDSETLLVANVDSIEYEASEEEVVEEADVEAPSTAPYRPKANKASAIAVEV